MPDIQHSNVAIKDATIHVAQAGQGLTPTFVFLHGWPESWRTWHDLIQVAAQSSRTVAIDLPGIGGSSRGTEVGAKAEIAAVVHALIQELRLEDVTLVGHDIGGMVTYAYLREFVDLRSAVIMDVPIPGVDPWEDFIRQPFLWHFALHAVPDLPEYLVTGRERDYLGYFYDLLSAHPDLPTAASRAEQIAAYESSDALTTGFDWYRAFPADARHNAGLSAGPPVATPLLYLRGEKERGGTIEPYVDGLRRAGVTNVEGGLLPAAGHFPQEEATEASWRIISEFAAKH